MPHTRPDPQRIAQALAQAERLAGAYSGLALPGNRRLPESATAGRIRAGRSGSGDTFRENRPERPGDEPRQRDHRLTARSRVPMVRERERETPQNLHVMVDRSASMHVAVADRPSKIFRATVLAAAVARIFARLGDRTTALFDIGPPLNAEQEETLELWLRPGALPHSGGTRRAVPLLLSDFLDPPERACAALTGYRPGAGAAVCIFDPDERDFPYTETVDLVDPETGEERRTPPSAGPEYRRTYAAHFASVTRALEAEGRTVLRHSTAEAPEPFLARLIEVLQS